MHARFSRPDFCSNREPSLLPFGFTGEGFLLPSYVYASRINLIITGSLEMVEEGVVLWERCDSSACGWVGPKGHQTKDNPWFWVPRNEWHCSFIVPILPIERGWKKLSLLTLGIAGERDSNRYILHAKPLILRGIGSVSEGANPTTRYTSTNTVQLQDLLTILSTSLRRPHAVLDASREIFWWMKPSRPWNPALSRCTYRYNWLDYRVILRLRRHACQYSELGIRQARHSTTCPL